MALQPVYSGRFQRDVKRCEKRGKDMAKLKALIVLLLAQSPLPGHYRDHPLQDDWRVGVMLILNRIGCCFTA